MYKNTINFFEIKNKNYTVKIVKLAWIRGHLQLFDGLLQFVIKISLYNRGLRLIQYLKNLTSDLRLSKIKIRFIMLSKKINFMGYPLYDSLIRCDKGNTLIKIKRKTLKSINSKVNLFAIAKIKWNSWPVPPMLQKV
jgi:hypothetical protein